ncbi:anti-sigma factor [Ilyomonas limi]|uniref:Anti-sigma factor n=1 Tax=Ilyomonas limi TaxID=2575867 RepID=A0A4V5UUF6_9BACT|nr:anti-sigma factor [Ilyomonas limi]TKK67383.1 anti-sigma factor [Ilyomonas limi]
MDLSCIISSGDLELYVLGMLSSEDAYKIEQLAKLFPEVQAELYAIEDALLNAANEVEESPSAAVKDQLFNRLKSLPVGNDATTSLPGAIPLSDGHTTAKIIPMYQPNRSNSGLIAAAVIGVLLAIGSIAYTFINNNRQRVQMAAMQQQMDSLQNYAAAQQQQLAQYASDMRFYRDTGYKMINLKPMPNRPKDILAQVFWDTRTKAVYATNISLPKAPEGKQYQLWAFVNGKPVSAGLFDEKTGTVEQMKTFNQAEAFGITLEKAGGVSSPTVSEMYVLGKV